AAAAPLGAGSLQHMVRMGQVRSQLSREGRAQSSRTSRPAGSSRTSRKDGQTNAEIAEISEARPERQTLEKEPNYVSVGGDVSTPPSRGVRFRGYKRRPRCRDRGATRYNAALRDTKGRPFAADYLRRLIVAVVEGPTTGRA